MSEKQKTYTVWAQCENCDYRGLVIIPYRQRVNEVLCTECGCGGLEKVHK